MAEEKSNTFLTETVPALVALLVIVLVAIFYVPV